MGFWGLKIAVAIAVLLTLTMRSGSELRDELLLVLFIIFILILCPIAFMTLFVILRGFAKKLKFFLIMLSIVFTSVVSAMGVIRFVLLPIRLEIMNGNKVLLWDTFPSTFCAATEIASNDTGLLVWGSRNVPSSHISTVKLRSQLHLRPTAFVVWPLHLIAGTFVSVTNIAPQAHKMKVVVFEGSKALKKWKKASQKDRVPIEECCSVTFATGQALKVTARQDDIYNIVIQSPQRTDTDDALPFDLQLNMTGLVYKRGDCDPIYCKTYLTSCEIPPPLEPRLILENVVLANRHPKVRSVKVQVTCKVRRWAFGLLFAILPLILVAVLIACMQFTKLCDSFSKSNVSAYDIDLE